MCNLGSAQAEWYEKNKRAETEAKNQRDEWYKITFTRQEFDESIRNHYTAIYRQMESHENYRKFWCFIEPKFARMTKEEYIEEQLSIFWNRQKNED